MKQVTLVILFVLATTATFCQDFRALKGTFKTLLLAIENKNLGLYKMCWNEERLEKEGMYTKLKNDPNQWNDLQAIFKGPQKLGKGEYLSGGSKYKVSVKSSKKSDGGGIGAISMIKIGEVW